MKRKRSESEVDFIGGGRSLTKDDEIAISNFIQSQKAKHHRKLVIKRAIKSSRRKAKT